MMATPQTNRQYSARGGIRLRVYRYRDWTRPVLVVVCVVVLVVGVAVA